MYTLRVNETAFTLSLSLPFSYIALISPLLLMERSLFSAPLSQYKMAPPLELHGTRPHYHSLPTDASHLQLIAFASENQTTRSTCHPWTAFTLFPLLNHFAGALHSRCDLLCRRDAAKSNEYDETPASFGGSQFPGASHCLASPTHYQPEIGLPGWEGWFGREADCVKWEPWGLRNELGTYPGMTLLFTFRRRW